MYAQWTRAVRRLANLSFASTLALLLCAPGVQAQDTIEEVLVTGTKREATVQDVPIAVTAITGEQLQKTFRTDILALNDMAPGVSLAQVAGFRAVAGGIRGTGQNSILVTQDSSVVVLIDDFALSNVQSQFVEMFDIERVEIYRGPQGTLFGKSATGGAISIVTKRPVMNELSAELGGQYGQFDPDDGETADIGKIRMAFNLPIIDDKLSIERVGRHWVPVVGIGRAPETATNSPAQAVASHQPLDSASGDFKAFPLHLSPDFAHAVDAEVILEDPADLDLQSRIALGAG